MAKTADGLTGGFDEFGRPVHAFNGITSARELAGISACSTAGIENGCARKDAPLTQPGGDRGAILTDGTVDQQIEGPRVLTVKRATGSLGHRKPHQLYDNGVGRTATPEEISRRAARRSDPHGSPAVRERTTRRWPRRAGSPGRLRT